MENTWGSSFQLPVNLPSESHPHQTFVSSKSVHCTPFQWLLCKTVQYWLSHTPILKGPADPSVRLHRNPFIFGFTFWTGITQSILDCFAQESLKGWTVDWCRTHRSLVWIWLTGQLHRPSKCAAPLFSIHFFTMGVNKYAYFLRFWVFFTFFPKIINIKTVKGLNLFSWV